MDINIVASHIAKCGTTALLNEVSCTPKPGLVDRANSGSHKDMDFYTFLNSTMAISPYLKSFATEGYNWDTVCHKSLSTIRTLGIDCEKAMFNATNGINTHKGAIFSLGIISACGAYCYKTHGEYIPEKIFEYAAIVAKPAMADFDLIKNKENFTKGEELYIKYGITGIRGEAANGYKSVLNFALPIIFEYYNNGYPTNTTLLQTLLSLMANVEDTNILARCTQRELNLTKTLAQKALSLGGATTSTGIRYIEDMNNIFVSLNISPGGCADLLAVGEMVYLMGQNHNNL